MISDAQRADLANRFTHHPPKDGQADLYQKIRLDARAMAEDVFNVTPQCREQSLALTHLEEFVFWTNAAIARHG